MAKDKNSFLLYRDIKHTVGKLSDEQAGKLFKHILSYVNDENPETDDILVEIAFEPIKQSLKRDLKKYETQVGKKSDSGRIGNLKRWHPELYKKVEKGSITLENAEGIAENRKCDKSIAKHRTCEKSIANIADSVSVSDSVSDILLEKETKGFDFKSELLKLSQNPILVNDWMKVRKTKKATNTETALKNFISEVEKSKKPLNDILTLCIKKDWKGFHHTWDTGETSIGLKSQTTIIDYSSAPKTF